MRLLVFCKYTDVKVMRGLEAGSVLVVYIILSFFGQLFAFMEPAKQPCTFTNRKIVYAPDWLI